MSEKYERNAIAAETTKNIPKIEGERKIVKRRLATNPIICMVKVL